MHRRTLAAAMAAGALGLPAIARAQAWPSQTVRIIVPFAPGGGTDLTARMAADVFPRNLGQNVVVENRPGAASQLGIDLVVRARPDGHTILWSSADGISILPAVKARMPYRIPESLDFISGFASFPLVMTVHAGLPVEDLAGFIAYAKANPGKLNYSSSGAGGGGHLLPAFISHSLGLDMVHISFNSAAPAVTAVAGGHAQVSFIAPSTAAPHVAAGSVRVLATSGRNRTSQFPELKTFAELGHPGFTRDFHYGVYAPAGTPQPILARLREEVAALLRMPATQARLNTIGIEPLDLDGPAFRDFVINDLNRWREIATAINFRLED